MKKTRGSKHPPIATHEEVQSNGTHASKGRSREEKCEIKVGVHHSAEQCSAA